MERDRGVRFHPGSQSPWKQMGRNRKNDSRKVGPLSSLDIYLPIRTDNAIKNHFYSTLRKLISRIQKDDYAADSSKQLFSP